MNSRSASLAVASAVAVAFAAGCTRNATAQDIGSLIRQTRSGVLRLEFAAKPGVCGDGETFISMNRDIDDEGERQYIQQTSRGINFTSGHGRWDYRNCDDGPVRVNLDVENGEVVDIDTYVGGRSAHAATTVSAPAAARFLLRLAETSTSTTVGKHAILPAVIADSIEPWSELLSIGRNEGTNRDVRRSAIFWLGQAAGDKAADGLKSVLNDEDVEVKKSAVFALSQIKGEKSLDALIDVAKNSKDRQVRKSALFWLAQKNDPRVLALFEDILLKH
jgi:hypothetical protein